MLDYGLPQKEKKSVMRGNVGAAATGLLQPTRFHKSQRGKVMWGNNLKLVLPGGFSGVLGGVRFAFSGGGGPRRRG